MTEMKIGLKDYYGVLEKFERLNAVLEEDPSVEQKTRQMIHETRDKIKKLLAQARMHSRYVIGEDEYSIAGIKTAWILCHQCGRKSYNRNDVEQKYCGHCHEWLEK